jgi:REP element-mobilizing transposase RayT
MEQALNALDDIKVVVAPGADAALQLVQRQAFDVLILDTDLGGISFGDLVTSLRRRLPELHVSILPPGKENTALPLLGFTPDGYLTRPLNALEVLEQIKDLSSNLVDQSQELDSDLVKLFSEIPPPDPITTEEAQLQPAEPKSHIPAASAWTRDPDTIAKVLAYLHMKTGAMGSFVILAGRSSWYTKSLSTEDRQDIEGWSQETFAGNPPEGSAGPGETVGFVQLQSSNQDCQVFVAPLDKVSLFGLVFGADVPFRKVRSQVTQLVRTLIESRKAPQSYKPGVAVANPPKSFTVVLVPRQAHQKLTGKISASISEWIQQIAASLGWQIEHLAVRPDHVLWVSTVPAQTLPENQVSLVCQYTSMRMNQVFPEVMKDNPAGDFWISEPFIRASIQPPAPQELRHYIQGIRRQSKPENKT